jgi:hypothetical protein
MCALYPESASLIVQEGDILNVRYAPVPGHSAGASTQTFDPLAESDTLGAVSRKGVP